MSQMATLLLAALVALAAVLALISGPTTTTSLAPERR
jgi:hypothetical protein